MSEVGRRNTTQVAWMASTPFVCLWVGIAGISFPCSITLVAGLRGASNTVLDRDGGARGWGLES